MTDEKLKDKFIEDNKKKLESLVANTIQWLRSNPNAKTSEYEAKQKELEEAFNPVIGGQGIAGTGTGGVGTQLDEVD